MRRLIVVAAASLALAAHGCGDDGVPQAPNTAGDGGARPNVGGRSVQVTDSEQFLLDYAAAVCAMYAPCCEAQGDYDAAGCTEWFGKVTAAYFGGTFRPDKAAACLAELEDAFASDPDRCSNVPSFDQATLRATCREAFGPMAREGAPLGGSCLMAADCASAPEDEEGRVICYARTCLIERKGKAGDGPCYLGSGSGIEGVPNVAVTCDAASGLWCDRRSNVCAHHVADGESCALPAACGPSGMCVGGRCESLPGPGEPCMNAIPGAGGFCRPGSACDVASLTCGPPLADGAACREPAQCASGSCMNGRCATPDFTRSLNCTGRR